MPADDDRYSSYTVTLCPSGRQLRAPAGSLLRNVLFKRETEMPCGGVGECRGCSVKVLAGQAAPCATELRRLRPDELADGWRLSCQTKIEGDLAIEMQPWMESCLKEDKIPSRFPHEALQRLFMLSGR